MVEIAMTIGGKSVLSATMFPVEDPSTGTVIGRAPEADRAQVRAAFASAESALGDWRMRGEERGAALGRLAELTERHLEELARLITLEEGKPLAEARREVGGACAQLRYFSGLVIADEILLDNLETTVKVVHRSLGVATAITPWNFPLGTAVAKIAPALTAGCTVVAKSSPFTPLSCLRFGELAREVLPAGVLNMLSGGDEVGRWMVDDPVPMVVSFTGSVDAGRSVASTAGRGLKSVVLELGGNDPAIVLDDLDPEEVVEDLFWNAFANCGQVCVAIKRLYVPETRRREFVDAFSAKAKAVRSGSGIDPGTELGPLCNPEQLRRVEGLVADALSRGAKVCTGGKSGTDRGYFFEPTIITEIEDGVPLVDEEQFGPVLPIIGYRDVQEAVGRANRSHFGLGASVWTSDRDRGAVIGAGLAAGTVWINTHKSTVDGQPEGGINSSGIGVEGGRYGALAFTQPQVFYLQGWRRSGLDEASLP